MTGEFDSAVELSVVNATLVNVGVCSEVSVLGDSKDVEVVDDSVLSGILAVIDSIIDIGVIWLVNIFCEGEDVGVLMSEVDAEVIDTADF